MRPIKFRAWDKDHHQMIHDLDGIALIRRFSGELVTIGTSYDLMQYTGLKDKNDKEIYEGDIVRCEGLVCRVDYVIEPAIAGFVFNQDGTGRYIEYAVRGGMAVHFEVIGNIYENPDLLPIQPKK